ncbi:MAG: hypothetical protein KUL83_03250 [Lentimicrobium sp.]|jgi:hypothetical protein|nr:hypothetical protein [Lentimicrobium sp.]
MTNEASTSVISADEVLRLIKLFEEAIVKGRSKDEIFKTFRDAGIISKNGDLKHPYKNISIPAEK